MRSTGRSSTIWLRDSVPSGVDGGPQPRLPAAADDGDRSRLALPGGGDDRGPLADPPSPEPVRDRGALEQRRPRLRRGCRDPAGPQPPDRLVVPAAGARRDGGRHPGRLLRPRPERLLHLLVPLDRGLLGLLLRAPIGEPPG